MVSVLVALFCGHICLFYLRLLNVIRKKDCLMSKKDSRTEKRSFYRQRKYSRFGSVSKLHRRSLFANPSVWEFHAVI